MFSSIKDKLSDEAPMVLWEALLQEGIDSKIVNSFSGHLQA